MSNIAAGKAESAPILSQQKAELLKLILGERPRQRSRIESLPRDESGRLRALTSWAQQRLWFIDRLEAGGRGYNICSAMQLDGQLDEQALLRSLNALVSRHEALRTIFSVSEGEPYQEIAGAAAIGWCCIDLCKHSAAERAAQLKLQMSEEVHEKFDLHVGPLIRARLIRMQPAHHVLLLTMHHIVSDGWSMGVLTRDFTELYDAFASGRSSALPPLPIQYADYAHWQRQWLQAEELEKQLSYWRARLSGAPPELNLPTDHPRPTVQSYRGGYVEVSLDAPLCVELRALAQRSGLTLFMVLYAGWAMLLSRLSGDDDVVIGTPIANRQRPELERLIGFFVNTLVLRIGVRAEASLEAFFDQVKQVTVGAFDHQDVPFEKIVEALQPQRSLSRNPLFQVMFALQNAPRDELRLPGLDVKLHDVDDDLAKFDLLLSLEERNEQIVGTLNYAADLFDRRTIERWRECFVTLLRALPEATGRNIGDLPVVPEHELRVIAESFNATDIPYRQGVRVHELFEAQVERTPDAEALRYGEQRLTYADLNRRANRLARHLQDCRGIGAGHLVGILLERSPEMVIGLLAILKAGAAYLPLDPNYPSERLQFMLQDAAPTVVLTQSHLAALLSRAGVEKVVLNAEVNTFESYDGADLARVPSESPAAPLVYVIYTSGSTGQPKGTAMSHGSMVNLLEWQRRCFDSARPQRVLQFAALSFDVAFQEILSTLVSGDTLVLLDEWVRRDPKALAELLSSAGINRLFVPPLMLQGLAEHFATTHVAVPECLCDVITAGEQLRISPEIVNFFSRLPRSRLHNHYGPTETHVVTALTMAGSPTGWPLLPSIGRPIANTRIYILDQRHQVVPMGVRGEIYIGGANVAQGYLRRPELTQQRFVQVPGIGERLYRTGDVGSWRVDGTIDYFGRNDDQVKLRGYRIELGEIATQLEKLNFVREAAVITREDSPGGKRLVAYLKVTDPSAVNVEQLRAELRSVLPDYMVPSAFVIVDAFPLTPSGKLNRRALPAPGQQAYESKAYQPPEGEIEGALAEIWQKLLRLDRIGRHDNFFELGGHSLLATRVVAHVDQVFDVELPLRSVFERPTIAALSGGIVEQIATQLSMEEL